MATDGFGHSDEDYFDGYVDDYETTDLDHQRRRSRRRHRRIAVMCASLLLLLTGIGGTLADVLSSPSGSASRAARFETIPGIGVCQNRLTSWVVGGVADPRFLIYAGEGFGTDSQIDAYISTDVTMDRAETGATGPATAEQGLAESTSEQCSILSIDHVDLTVIPGPPNPAHLTPNYVEPTYHGTDPLAHTKLQTAASVTPVAPVTPVWPSALAQR